jgi:N-acetylneuraminic acid mutarotase
MAEMVVTHPLGAPVTVGTSASPPSAVYHTVLVKLTNKWRLVQVDIEFHGITYAVCVTVNAEVLVIEIEDRDSFNKWRGEFTSKCELLRL